MYNIVTEEPQPIPAPDNLPLKLILHPSISGDAIKLIAYIISEYHHNPRAQFRKEFCIKHTGIKRCALNVAISKLTDLHILSLYNGPGKTHIVELDYSGLLDLLKFAPTNVLRVGHSNKAIAHRINQHSKDDYAF